LERKYFRPYHHISRVICRIIEPSFFSASLIVLWSSFLMLANAIFRITGATVDQAYMPGPHNGCYFYLPYYFFVVVRLSQKNRLNVGTVIDFAILGSVLMLIHGYLIIFREASSSEACKLNDGMFFYLFQGCNKKKFAMPLPIERKIHDRVEAKHPFFSTSVDFYLKWIPYATVFILNLTGVRTKSDWKKQVLMTAATDGFRYLITDSLKKITHEHRPAPNLGNHSFPSGHTSSSFAGAELMHQELKSSFPVLSCAGYIGAAATGFIRVYKNRHWLRDVVAGAVVGIVSAKLAYFLVNKFWRKSKSIMKETDPNAKEEKFAGCGQVR
jgi:membrane-associated phospholipid phosphatase